MKVIIANNNNNNNKNSNNSTSCVGYLQSSEGGESGVLSPAGAGLCKKCLSASGQFKTKIKTKQNKKNTQQTISRIAARHQIHTKSHDCAPSGAQQQIISSGT